MEKAKGAQALTLLKSLYNAQQAYYLANGAYPSSFDELDVELLSWTGNEKWNDSEFALDTRSNGEWSLQLYSQTGTRGIFMGRLKGAYKGAGFTIYNDSPLVDDGVICCMERKSGGVIFDNHEKGDFCVKIWRGEEIGAQWHPTFKLP